jgi:small membrane protein
MDNQLIIKIILIVLFVVFGIALILPAVGARRLAIRRILLLLATLAAVVAIAFPELVNGLANLVGVGRGTDLVLYVLVVVFIGNSISNSIRHRQLEREVTKLARQVAISSAPAPVEREIEREQQPGGEGATGAAAS